MHIHRRPKCAYALSLMLCIAGGRLLGGSELKEPITIASENGVLDILMIAKSASVSTLPSSPDGWVYEICKRPAAPVTSCPASVEVPNYYGGTLLQLRAGDVLRVHLVNQLPPALNSKHAEEEGHDFLTLNPTNLHTHGMLVSPHGPKPDNPTYGDNVFVLTFNSANGKPTMSPHMHSDVRFDFTDYEIKVPKDHPSGLFWFHPHAHGLALNQISSGLSGIITVGDLKDYVCKDRACGEFISNVATRHLILKDMQVLSDGEVQDQEDPDFCSQVPKRNEPAREGSCPEDVASKSGPTGRTKRGNWFFTLNGQVYPEIPIKANGGEIWRLTNASGSVTYDLNLWNPTLRRNMLFQVISIDGVSVKPTAGMSRSQMKQITGGKFDPEGCPGWEPDGLAEDPICTRTLHMMPSSRIEVWVTPRDKNDLPSAPHARDYALFRTSGYTTGDSGDSWPAVDLARVEFQGTKWNSNTPKALRLKGDAVALLTPTALSADLAVSNSAVGADSSCKALPPGHMRRIFYGIPMDNPDAFGLAYEEIDEHGKVVGEAATDVTPFDPMRPTVCVPLGPGNSAMTERWQLVNVATEDHNFHIHQVKFRLLTNDEIAGTILPGAVGGKGVLMDNVPLAAATGSCGNNPPTDVSSPIADWRAGLCKSDAITVEIPFTIAGDFVYHCHILEHEDGGMMARIRVRANK